jgi:tetratricopeptide (TPR) repeat protein
LGEYEDALDSANKGLELAPDDSMLLACLHDIEGGMNPVSGGGTKKKTGKNKKVNSKSSGSISKKKREEVSFKSFTEAHKLTKEGLAFIKENHPKKAKFLFKKAIELDGLTPERW